MNSSPTCLTNFQSLMPYQALTQLDVHYLKSIKNDIKTLLPLFQSAVKDDNFWQTQKPTIRNKFIILVYKIQLEKNPADAQLDILKNTQNISPFVSLEIKKTIEDYTYRRNLNLTITFINKKADKLLLDNSKILQIEKDSFSLSSLLINENTNIDIFIEELTNIFDDTQSNEINIQILPYLLKLAQECELAVFSSFLNKNLFFFENLINTDDSPSDNDVDGYFVASNTIFINLNNYNIKESRLKFFIEIFDYLKVNVKIIFNYNLADSNDFELKARLLSEFKKNTKKIIFSAEYSSDNSCGRLDNLKALLKSGVLDEVREIEFNNCRNLEVLPEEMSLLSNLRVLSIENRCDELKNVSELKNLVALEKLSLSKVKEIPKDIEELKNLKSLSLNNISSENQRINLSQLRNLESLHLQSVKLESLIEEIWSLPKIKKLYITPCRPESFKIPIEKVISLKNLQSVNLPNLTLEERLQLFFSFSGQIQIGLIATGHEVVLYPLLHNVDFYLSEKKDQLVNLGLLLVEINALKKSAANNEQMLDQLSQKLECLAISLFEINEEKDSWIYNCLNNKKLSYGERVKHLDWFSSFLAKSSLKSNAFLDESAYPTLIAIFNLTDSFMQDSATKLLLSFYQIENKQKLNIWLTGLRQLKNWQVLPYLFLVKAEIADSLRESIIKGLNNRYYQDATKIKPIIEILHLLIKQQDLTKEDFENIFQLILIPIQPLGSKGRNEKKADFEKRKNDFLASQKAFRQKQLKYINMLKSLISMNKSAYLKGVKEENLLERLQEACKENFGMKKENTLALFGLFQSERYPNALVTYTSSICILPKKEKEEFLQRLGKFIDDLIGKNFPESRYCISPENANNLHLNTVFKTEDGKINQQLLEEWKSSFIIDIDSNGQPSDQSSIPPQLLVRDRILQALIDNHLGPNFKALYPKLYKFLQEDTGDIERIRSLINDLQQLLNTALDEEKRKLLNIETKCLKLLALDEQHSRSFIIAALKGLEFDISESQFKQDLKDIVALLQPKGPPSRFVSIEDTDLWEDWLLMGTEVMSSCQSITAFSGLNKALLSYITDGKYKLIIVRDAARKIAARRVLRILWDNKLQKPVLFMERMYTRYNDPALEGYITQGCIKKAEKMGLCLVVNSDSSLFKNYEGSLSSLSSPNPYEYVDAEGLGIVATHGKYILKKNLKIVYEAKLK